MFWSHLKSFSFYVKLKARVFKIELLVSCAGKGSHVQQECVWEVENIGNYWMTVILV